MSASNGAWFQGGSVSAPSPHGAAVVTGAQIEAELGRPALPAAFPSAASEAAQPFTIHGAPPFPQPALRRFGTREAVAAPVSAARGHRSGDLPCRSHARRLAVPDSARADAAWLLGVGCSPEALLAQSRLVAPVIDTLGTAGARFETAPRLLDQLAGPD